MLDDLKIHPQRALILRLAFHYDPEAWRPFYADIEVGRYRDIFQALAEANKPLRKNAGKKAREDYHPALIVRRLQALLRALEFQEADIPTLERELFPYHHRAVPPNLP